MKTLLLLSGMALSAVCADAQQYTIKGDMTDHSEKYIFVSHRNAAGKMRRDSAKIENGHFLLTGSVSEPTPVILHFSSRLPSRREDVYKSIIIEPAVMKLHIKGKDLANATFTGSVTGAESDRLDSAIQQVQTETKALSDKFDKERDVYEAAVKNNAGDHVLDSLKEVMAAIHEQFGPYNNRVQDLMLQFIIAHPDSYLSGMKLIYFVNALPLDSVQHLYKNLSPVVRESESGKEVAKGIQKVISGSPGSVAPDFSTVDINAKPLSLKSFRGGYVLLDFWASWCVPCRHGNPHLIELYNKYNSKGFTIIGVSDNDREPLEWKKAVEKDKIGIWHHVLRGLDMKKRMDGIPYETDISEKFGIASLPTKILIDKNGVIIGRYGEGRDDEGALDKKLAELL